MHYIIVALLLLSLLLPLTCGPFTQNRTWVCLTSKNGLPGHGDFLLVLHPPIRDLPETDLTQSIEYRQKYRYLLEYECRRGNALSWKKSVADDEKDTDFIVCRSLHSSFWNYFNEALLLIRL